MQILEPPKYILDLLRDSVLFGREQRKGLAISVCILMGTISSLSAQQRLAFSLINRK